VSLIKSLLSNEGEARVVICNIVSIEDDDDDVGDGSHRRFDKLPLRFYTNERQKKRINKSFFILNISSKETTLFLCNSTLINTEHDHYLCLSKYQFLPMIDLKIYLLKDDHIFH